MFCAICSNFFPDLVLHFQRLNQTSMSKILPLFQVPSVALHLIISFENNIHEKYSLTKK